MANIALTLPKGQGPSFSLSSNLAGLGLAIPKSAGATAKIAKVVSRFLVALARI
jgi:hypothetical protein